MIDLDRLAELLLDLEAVGVEKVIPEGDNLRLVPTVAIPSDLLARVKLHKADLLAALRPMYQPAAPVVTVAADTPGDLGEVIDPPPCPRCGLLEMWETAAGTWRCLRCDPPKVAIRLLERAQAIRQRLGMPARPETAAILADLRRLTSPAVRPDVAAGPVDTLDLQSDRPAVAYLRGSSGV